MTTTCPMPAPEVLDRIARDAAEILDCGHMPTAPTAFHGNGVPLTNGRCRLADGRTACYSCADSAQAAEIATSDIAYVYVSTDGKSLTTWTGGVLLRVTHEWTSRGAFGREIVNYRATDVDGRRWHGKGSGRGMSLTIRKVI